MPHVIEPASSGRAKCRGCGERIAKDELRFGERLPNPYAEGEMTLWFHPVCGALKRPEPFLEALTATTAPLEQREWLETAAKQGIEHRRLPRVNGAQRAPTGRARCRSCREMIEKDAWRIALVYFDDARFEPSGFVHVRCSRGYFETIDLVDRVKQFTGDLSDDDLDEIQGELESTGTSAAPE